MRMYPAGAPALLTVTSTPVLAVPGGMMPHGSMYDTDTNVGVAIACVPSRKVRA